MKKRIVTLMIAAVFAFGMTACSGQSDQPEDDSTASADQEEDNGTASEDQADAESEISSWAEGLRL